MDGVAMDGETYKWIIGGLLTIIGGGGGYLFMRIDHDMRELKKGMHSLELAFARAGHGAKPVRKRSARKV